MRQTVGANPPHDKEIKRIGMGWSAFGKVGDVMNSNLPLSLKGKVYNQCVLPILTYGSKTWHLTKEQERKLRSARRGMERKMLGITRRHRKRATFIREQTKVGDTLTTIKMRKWSWAGHVMRRTDNRWTKRVTEWQPRNCKRRQGRQRVRWRDEITAFAGAGWSTLTSDRERRKRLGKAFVMQWTTNG